MLISSDRILEVFFGCVEKKPNPKPGWNNLIKFDEFLEKLSISKMLFSTKTNLWTYLQIECVFGCQPLLIKIEKRLKINPLTQYKYVDNSI